MTFHVVRSTLRMRTRVNNCGRIPCVRCQKVRRILVNRRKGTSNCNIGEWRLAIMKRSLSRRILMYFCSCNQLQIKSCIHTSHMIEKSKYNNGLWSTVDGFWNTSNLILPSKNHAHISQRGLCADNKVRKTEISVQNIVATLLWSSVSHSTSLMEYETDWHMIPQIYGQTHSRVNIWGKRLQLQMSKFLLFLCRGVDPNAHTGPYN